MMSPEFHEVQMYLDCLIYYLVGLILSFMSFYHEISEEKRREEDKKSIDPLRNYFANAVTRISMMDRPLWYFLIKYFIVIPLLMGFWVFLLRSCFGKEF